VNRDLEHTGQIITVSAEDLIDSNRDVNVNVTSGPAREANFALTGKLKTQTVFDSGGNIELECAFVSNSPLASAIDARRRYRLPKASARGAWHVRYYIAEQRTHLALNLAGSPANIAGSQCCARLAAGTLAGVADNRGVDVNTLGQTEYGLSQGKVNSQ
jgi:hypothetical protein